jgi:hypothetical protein
MQSYSDTLSMVGHHVRDGESNNDIFDILNFLEDTIIVLTSILDDQAIT